MMFYLSNGQFKECMNALKIKSTYLIIIHPSLGYCFHMIQHFIKIYNRYLLKYTNLTSDNKKVLKLFKTIV